PALTTFSFLSLHDALPISAAVQAIGFQQNRTHRFLWFRVRRERLDPLCPADLGGTLGMPRRTNHGGVVRHVLGLKRRNRNAAPGDRKSTRLNSSHVSISYA